MTTPTAERLAPGTTAPEFTLPDSKGRPVSLSDYAGRTVIVYFYPAALTPGCTIEAVDFSASLPDLQAAGYDVVGISPDEPEKLAKFHDQEQLGLTLLSDPQRQVLDAYGAYGEKMLYGKRIEGVIRSTFVIKVDADGVGTIEIARYNVRAKGHVASLRKELGIA